MPFPYRLDCPYLNTRKVVRMEWSMLIASNWNNERAWIRWPSSYLDRKMDLLLFLPTWMHISYALQYDRLLCMIRSWERKICIQSYVEQICQLCHWGVESDERRLLLYPILWYKSVTCKMMNMNKRHANNAFKMCNQKNSMFAIVLSEKTCCFYLKNLPLKRARQLF
jgi:hypothetical protein